MSARSPHTQWSRPTCIKRGWCRANVYSVEERRGKAKQKINDVRHETKTRRPRSPTLPPTSTPVPIKHSRLTLSPPPLHLPPVLTSPTVTRESCLSHLVPTGCTEDLQANYRVAWTLCIRVLLLFVRSYFRVHWRYVETRPPYPIQWRVVVTWLSVSVSID